MMMRITFRRLKCSVLRSLHHCKRVWRYSPQHASCPYNHVDPLNSLPLASFEVTNLIEGNTTLKTRMQTGHLNPAVTVGTMITGHLQIHRGVCYVIAQISGACIGTLILASHPGFSVLLNLLELTRLLFEAAEDPCYFIGKSSRCTPDLYCTDPWEHEAPNKPSEG